MVVLGRALDLGMCQVLKRDGNICGGWCDKRVSDVCEWHVQSAVERRRAGRAEFSIGYALCPIITLFVKFICPFSTSGMSMSSAPTRKPAYDPVKQWGLKPEPSVGGGTGGSATYVVSGHVVGGPAGNSRSLYVAETMGREGQAKAKRKFGQDADRELKALLERDKEGMRAVVRAREVGKMLDEKSGKRVKKRDKGKGKDKGREKPSAEARSEKLDDSNSDSGSDLAVEEQTSTSAQKNAYSAQIIKQLGFDPAMKPGQKRADDLIVKKKVCLFVSSFGEHYMLTCWTSKLETLTAVQSSRKEVKLGPRPGQRIRSGVVVPSNLLAIKMASAVTDATHDSDDSNGEVERGFEEMNMFGRPTLLDNMVDLDGSSDVDNHD